MTSVPAPPVDVNVPRFNQAVVAVLTGIAFVFDMQWLVATIALILLVSRFGGPRLSPLTQIYVQIIRPRLQPDGPIEFEAPEPPRFAQLLGGVFLTAATVAFAVDFVALGWTLSLTVTALAALAASTRICVGCLIYERAVT
jgi:hypothetical protein